MNSDTVRTPTALRRTSGFTLVEAAISIILVGVLLVAAINTLGATAVSKRNIEHQARGYTLAQDLMAEILSQAYEEPVDTVTFGRESESGGDRTDWDDIDDYEGWSATPPEDKDGVPLDGYDQWTRSVEIAFVQTASLNNEVGVNTGVKRITVTASFNGVPAAELVAIRTLAWPNGK